MTLGGGGGGIGGIENGNNINDTNDGNDVGLLPPATPYRPPDTLPTPMKFRDAFMSSVRPSETIRDIRRLRNGVDQAVNDVTNPGTISLQDMPGSNVI